MDCIFCKIGGADPVPGALYNDREVFAINDIHPKAPVHILILPRRHIPSIAHLDDADGATVAKLIHVARELAQERNLSGYKLVFNVGRGGGQMIDHLHLHLVGGWTDGSGSVEHVPV